jgi:RNA 2',3'-cyclic 3'-phosphodiesterase
MARDRSARPEARPLRLFVAVDIPETVRRGLAGVVEALHEALPGARWVAPVNWHVTMKFLGSVYPRLRDWVGEQVADAARGAEPFETRLTEMGAFPSPRRARVLWAGLEDAGGRFAGIAGELDRRLEREFRVEKRPFSAHLTVARFREQARLDEEMLGLEVTSEGFPVEALTLYRSYLQRPAARYERVARFPLGV